MTSRRYPASACSITEVLDDTELARLIAGFKGSPLYPIVAVSALAGPRLRETIALAWENVDLENRIITISRAIEETKVLSRLQSSEDGTRIPDLQDR